MPTADGARYGRQEEGPDDRPYKTFGGGTFDISILEVGGGVVEVKIDHGRHPPGRATTSTSGSGVAARRVQERIRGSNPARPDGPFSGLKEADEKAKDRAVLGQERTSTCPSSPRTRKAEARQVRDPD